MATLAATPEPTSTAAPIRLELTRVIRAPQARVFDAWTRPDMIRQWFGPHGMAVPNAETNPVEGGAYAITMAGTRTEAEAERPSQTVGHQTTVRGTYTKVSPFDLLQFTWISEWAPDEASLVTIHLRTVEGGTELRLVHERIGSESNCQGYTQGWTGCLDKLEAWAS